MYPHMVRAYPEADTEDSLNGTAAHWHGEQLIRGQTLDVVAPNGVVLDDTMRESAAVYAHDVRKTLHEFNQYGPLVWGVEKTIEAPDIHPTLCGGTPDTFMYSAAKHTLITWQFKHGHEEVSEFQNLQEVASHSGLQRFLNIDGHAEQSLKSQIRIVQPRCFTAKGSVRTWFFKAPEIRPLVNQLANMASEAMTNPTARSGDHCTHCPGRAHCPAARQSAYRAMDYINRSGIETLTPDAMSLERTLLTAAAARIETRLSGLDEQMKSTIRGGTQIPNYGLEGVVGRLNWKKDISPDAIRTLGLMVGKQLEKPNQFITPTQAIDMGVDENIISAYAERNSKGVKLVERGAEYIRRIFGNVPQE